MVAQQVQQQAAATSPPTLPSMLFCSRTSIRESRVGMHGMINAPTKQWRHLLFSNLPAFSTCKQQWQKYPHKQFLQLEQQSHNPFCHCPASASPFPCPLPSPHPSPSPILVMLMVTVLEENVEVSTALSRLVLRLLTALFLQHWMLH